MPPFGEQDNVVTWWTDVISRGKYPALFKVVGGALSMFHGPKVESSFNVMGDILDTKSCRMNVGTFNAIQTVSYAFQARGTSSLSYFKRPDKIYTPVNRRLCRKLRMSAARYAKKQAEQKEHVKQRHEQFQLGAKKTVSKAEAKRAVERATEQARKVHEKEKKKTRERLLEQMAARVQKKQRLM